MLEKSPIVLYDDQCAFCSFWVNFILKKDHRQQFLFAGLSSKTAHEILSKYPFAKNLDTVMLLHNQQLSVKSNAALKIAYLLGGGLKLLYVFKIVPKTIRDYFYDLIAKNRKKLMKKSGCDIQLYQQNKFKFLP